jgi:inner membrane transporter RhtA
MLGVRGYAYIAGSAVFHYLGPAFAVLLFGVVPPAGVAWLRIATAAAVYAVWRRPWRGLRAATPAARRSVAGMGAVLGVMNPVFYLAIARLPLGTVAAIEFLPVVALACAGVRTARNALALVAAVAGVYLVTRVRLAGQPLGYACAFADATLFALYIVLAHRVSRERSLAGVDGLAAAMLVALVVITPLGAWSARPAFLRPGLLAAGAGVGISSSVIPYACDQLAMRRLSRSTYALAVALLPATATVIGLVVLAQIPSPRDVAGVGLVVIAMALHRERSGTRPPGRRWLSTAAVWARARRGRPTHMPPRRPPDDGSERRDWQRRVVCAEINKRRVNEAIEKGRGPRTDGTFVCECGRVGCNAMLHLTLDEYARVRTSFDRFLIAPGHEVPEVDQVSERHGEYAVAVKRGEAGALLQELDPGDASS